MYLQTNKFSVVSLAIYFNYEEGAEENIHCFERAKHQAEQIRF